MAHKITRVVKLAKGRARDVIGPVPRSRRIENKKRKAKLSWDSGPKYLTEWLRE